MLIAVLWAYDQHLSNIEPTDQMEQRNLNLPLHTINQKNLRLTVYEQCCFCNVRLVGHTTPAPGMPEIQFSDIFFSFIFPDGTHN